MNKIITKLFIIPLLCCLAGVKVRAQVKTIVFDWKAKSFSSAFPFDEKFQIKIANLPSSVKSPLHLKVVKLDDSKIKSAKDAQTSATSDPLYSSVVVDTNYYHQLDGQELTFRFADTASVISVEFASLLPNQNYVILVNGSTVKKLTEAEKLDFQNKLNSDATFKKDVYDKILAEDYFKLKPKVLNGVMLSAVQRINKNYQLDLVAVDNKISDVVREIGLRFTEIDDLVKAIKPNLTKNIDAREFAKIGPFDMIDTLQIKTTGYSKRYNVLTAIDVLNSLLKKQLTATSYAKVDKKLANIKTGVTTDNLKIDSLLNDLIMSVLPESMSDETIQFIGLNNTIPGTIESRASIYISQSAGAGYSARTGNIISYLNYSFFFRPVNQEISLDTYKGGDFWKVRLCLNVGFTFNKITTNRNGTISGTLGDKAIVLGAGFRLLSFLKLDLNNAFYYLDDPNPLIKHKRFNSSPVIGLSLNMNIAKLFAGQANPLTDLTTLFK